MGSDCPVIEKANICRISSNFCLRDYVSAARKNDTAGNWPFQSKHLDICRKHGINDVLPPFESRLSAKNDSSKKDKDFRNHPLKEEFPCANSMNENSDDININICEKTNESGSHTTWIKKAIVDVSKQICSLTIGGGRHCRFGEEYFTDSNKNISCFSEIRRIPELIHQAKIVGLTSTVSADQIPNTSLPSTLTLVKSSKRKGKRKTRLLVDIYAEAKHVALEETDQISSYPCRESMKYKKKPDPRLGILRKKHSSDLSKNHLSNKKRCVKMLRSNECQLKLDHRLDN